MTPVAQLTGGPARATVRRVAAGQLRLARQAPATVTFVVLMWVVGAVQGSLLTGPSARLRDQFGASVAALSRHRLHTLLTSALWSSHLVGYVVSSLALLAVGVVAERRWGTPRLVVVAVLTQVLGQAAGLLTVQLLGQVDATWSTDLATTSAVGNGALAAGVAMAYSGSAGALWRRRIRIGVLATVLTVMLYGGLLQDVLRVSTALVGLAVCAVLAGRRPRQLGIRSSRHETRVLVAVTLVATAVGPVLAVASPTAVGPLAVLRYLFTSPEATPAQIRALCLNPGTADVCSDLHRQLRVDGVGPALLSALPAVLVLVLAVGLRRGRRFAYLAAVAVHAVLAGLGALLALTVLLAPTRDPAVLALADTHNVVGLAIPLVQPLLILVLLLLTRRAFDVSAPPGTYARVGRRLAGTAGALLLGYVLLGSVLARGFSPPPGPLQLALDFPLRLVPPGYLGVVEPGMLPTSMTATVLFEWTGVLMWGAVIIAVLNSYRHSDRHDTAEDAVAAREILHQHGRSALSYLSTWRGNSYWFDAARSCFVAYRVEGGVAITTGDPVGPEWAQRSAAREFARFCAGQGWTPCFYSVTAGLRDITAEWGWACLQVAEETVLPLGELTFAGRRFQDVRTAFNRAGKEGITARWISYPDAPRPVTDQIRALSEEWVADKGLPEMGFTLGGLDELDDPAVRCLLATGVDGTVQAVTSWLPVYRDGPPVGWTLDFMRRRAEGPNGVMEFLIGTAALQFQSEGAEFVSLSGAPLARVDAARAPSGLQRLLDLMGRGLEPVYGFGSLLAFKAKFQPTYRPLFLAYPDATALPRIANAISRAYLPHLTLRQGARLLRRL